MTTAQLVEASVTANNNSPIQDYVHPDDQSQPAFTMIIITIYIQFQATVSLVPPGKFGLIQLYFLFYSFLYVFIALP